MTLGSFWDHFAHSWVTLVHFQKTIIFKIDFNDFIKLWGEFWVDSGLLGDVFWHLRVTLGPFWGHFGITLGSLWAYRRRMATMMHICSGLVGPKSGNVENVLVFKAFFEGSRRA